MYCHIKFAFILANYIFGSALERREREFGYCVSIALHWSVLQCPKLSVDQSVTDELGSVVPQVERLKSASALLQKALPSAEAKVTLQDRFMTLLENYERSELCVCSVLPFTHACTYG